MDQDGDDEGCFCEVKAWLFASWLAATHHDISLPPPAWQQASDRGGLATGRGSSGRFAKSACHVLKRMFSWKCTLAGLPRSSSGFRCQMILGTDLAQ